MTQQDIIDLQQKYAKLEALMARTVSRLREVVDKLENLEENLETLRHDQSAQLAGLPNLMSYKQVLRLIAIEPKALTRLRQNGVVRGTKVGSSYKYHRADIIKLLQQVEQKREQSAGQTPAIESSGSHGG